MYLFILYLNDFITWHEYRVSQGATFQTNVVVDFFQKKYSYNNSNFSLLIAFILLYRKFYFILRGYFSKQSNTI